MRTYIFELIYLSSDLCTSVSSFELVFGRRGGEIVVGAFAEPVDAGKAVRPGEIPVVFVQKRHVGRRHHAFAPAEAMVILPKLLQVREQLSGLHQIAAAQFSCATLLQDTPCSQGSSGRKVERRGRLREQIASRASTEGQRLGISPAATTKTHRTSTGEKREQDSEAHDHLEEAQVVHPERGRGRERSPGALTLLCQHLNCGYWEIPSGGSSTLRKKTTSTK